MRTVDGENTSASFMLSSRVTWRQSVNFRRRISAIAPVLLPMEWFIRKLRTRTANWTLSCGRNVRRSIASSKKSSSPKRSNIDWPNEMVTPHYLRTCCGCKSSKLKRVVTEKNATLQNMSTPWLMSYKEPSATWKRSSWRQPMSRNPWRLSQSAMSKLPAKSTAPTSFTKMSQRGARIVTKLTLWWVS